MSKQNMNSEITSETRGKSLPKYVLAICYILLIVLFFVAMFLALQTYGRLSMSTYVDYAIYDRYTDGKTRSSFLAKIYNVNKIDNVTIEVVCKDDIYIGIIDGAIRCITVSANYEQYYKDKDGVTQTDYDRSTGRIIEFDNKKDAKKYYDLMRKTSQYSTNDKREIFVINCYYFDLPVCDVEWSSGSNLTLEQQNGNNKCSAIESIRDYAESLSSLIYKICG